MKNSLAIFIIFMLSSCSCKKETTQFQISCSHPTNNMTIINNNLKGTYIWCYSIVKILGQNPFYDNPTKSGINRKYYFDGWGNVNYYENDTLQTSNNYTIDYEFKISTFPGDSSTMVIFKDKVNNTVLDYDLIYLCTDSMILYNPLNSIDVKEFYKKIN